MKKLALVFLITFSLLPNFSLAATTTNKVNTELSYKDSFVQCDGVKSENEPNRQNVCNFVGLINSVKYIINWAFAISIPVIIGLLAWSGLLHMTGKQANIEKSYKIMQNAVFGFIIMITAWFIVTTLLKWVLKPEFSGVVNTLVETQK